jgi:nucleotidyltransferase substrate binding protein (TIGR01987 family)
MNKEYLDLTSLKKAISSLLKSIIVFDELDHMGVTEDQLNVVKLGVIQHFEFCYELCWKFIKRWLNMNVSPDIADGVTRRGLFRLGAENKLLEDVDEWMVFHSARNQTLHTYDELVAEKVFIAARKFLPYAQNLLSRLEIEK